MAPRQARSGSSARTVRMRPAGCSATRKIRLPARRVHVADSLRSPADSPNEPIRRCRPHPLPTRSRRRARPKSFTTAGTAVQSVYELRHSGLLLASPNLVGTTTSVCCEHPSRTKPPKTTLRPSGSRPSIRVTSDHPSHQRPTNEPLCRQRSPVSPTTTCITTDHLSHQPPRRTDTPTTGRQSPSPQNTATPPPSSGRSPNPQLTATPNHNPSGGEASVRRSQEHRAPTIQAGRSPRRGSGGEALRAGCGGCTPTRHSETRKAHAP